MHEFIETLLLNATQLIEDVLIFKIITSVLIIFIGYNVITIVKKILTKIMKKRAVDPAIMSFVISLLHTGLWLFVIITSLSHLGIHTTSLIAVLGAAGLAIGLAFQNSLSNFAAGFLLILYRPIRVDDMIETAGIMGTVKGISLLTTEIRSLDNKVITIPNSQVMNNVITNLTAKPLRRVDLSFCVVHASDTQQVKELISQILTAHQLIHKEPEAWVRLSSITLYGLNFVVRAWTNSEHYWTVYFDLTEKVKEVFDQNGVQFATASTVFSDSQTS